jgi:hypothetical protein
MYFCATDVASFYDFSIAFKNCTDSVISCGFNFINTTSNIRLTITKTFDVKNETFTIQLYQVNVFSIHQMFFLCRIH